jgi:hypothetical protein
VLVGILSSQAEDFDAAFIRETGAKYQKNCMGCHQPPDLRFATDKAWLGQIRETT